MDVEGKALLPVRECFKVVYGDKRLPDWATIKRWQVEGILGIRLPLVRVGGTKSARWRITPDALVEWISAVQDKVKQGSGKYRSKTSRCNDFLERVRALTND